jgi:hypothetical protein
MKSILPVIAILVILAVCVTLPAAAAVYYSASTPQIITKGDEFTVSGTGAKNGTVALWVIGRGYFGIKTVAPDRHGNFSIVFKPTETAKFSTGQYAIVLQEPGASGTMEIEPGRDTGGNLTLMNRGKIIARFGTVADLPGNVEKETSALVSSSSLQGVDDTFRSEYFFVEDPAVHFNGIIPASGSRLADQVSGKQIQISGTSNMRTDDVLTVEISNADSPVPVTSKEIAVLPGTSLNQWSYVLEEPGLKPGNYCITVGWTTASMSGNDTAFFTVKSGETGPIPHDIIPVPTGEIPLPKGLDTLLILGIVFVSAVVVYTMTKK